MRRDAQALRARSFSQFGSNPDASGHDVHDAPLAVAAGDTLPAPVAGGDGQEPDDTHASVAVSDTLSPRKRGRPRKALCKLTPKDGVLSSATESAGQKARDTHGIAASRGEVGSNLPDYSAAAWQLKELQFRRVTYTREINALQNRAEAMIRRALGWQPDMPEKQRIALNKRAAAMRVAMEKGERVEPLAEELRGDVVLFFASRKVLEEPRAEVVAEMESIAQTFPAWTEWAKGVRGFGARGFAVTIGITGDLFGYATVSKVWKRLGLAVINGERQRRISGNSELAKEHGYAPKRRAEMYTFFSDSMLRSQWAGGHLPEDPFRLPRPLGPYGAVYGREKARALPRVEATAHLDPKHPDKWTTKRVDNHARRLMTKALLRDLWRVWHGQAPRGDARPDAQEAERRP